MEQIECLSTSYNTLSVTISESIYDEKTDICLRVTNRDEFKKLKKLMNAVSLNAVLVLDTDDIDKRETYNLSFDGIPPFGTPQF